MTDEQVKRNMAVNVRRLMEDRGWNGAELARRSGESEMNVSRLLKQQNTVNVAIAKRIAHALASSLDYLTEHHDEFAVV